MHPLHEELLHLIVSKSGKGTQHTFSDSYLGNDHPRYPISNPVLRSIAKDWMKAHRDLSPKEFCALLSSLNKGKSSTEKCFVGILMGYATKEQRRVDPKYFDQWLDELIGWVEVDTLCTGKHIAVDLPDQWNAWKKVVDQLSKSKNINKRRASIVLLVSPLSRADDEKIAQAALRNINRIKSEKEVLITKAISWVLRSMVKHHSQLVNDYIKDNLDTLPKIAIRETMAKLKTGRKTPRS